MAGRPAQYDETEVLARAAALFWAKGYEATSAEELTEAMGMGKGSLYNAFGSKQALFDKVMERFSNPAIAKLRKEIEGGAEPLAAIKAFFRGMAGASDVEKRNGCFMGNTLASNCDAQAAAERLKQLEYLFETLLTGKIDSPKTVARYLVTQWNGLNITRRIYPNPEDLKSLIELQLKILDQ